MEFTGSKLLQLILMAILLGSTEIKHLTSNFFFLFKLGKYLFFPSDENSHFDPCYRCGQMLLQDADQSPSMYETKHGLKQHQIRVVAQLQIKSEQFTGNHLEDRAYRHRNKAQGHQQHQLFFSAWSKGWRNAEQRACCQFKKRKKKKKKSDLRTPIKF